MEVVMEGARKSPPPTFQNIYPPPPHAFPYYYLLRQGISEIRPWERERGRRGKEGSLDKLPPEKEEERLFLVSS